MRPGVFSAESPSVLDRNTSMVISIVLVTFVTLITTAGLRATPGVLIVPLHDEYGWSRGSISVGISIGLVLFGLTAPFSAALMDKLNSGEA